MDEYNIMMEYLSNEIWCAKTSIDLAHVSDPFLYGYQAALKECRSKLQQLHHVYKQNSNKVK